MASRDEQAEPGGERTKREVRADRILNAALELLQRWGYRKTTIEDIAKQAGVAKGTVYLHWKTREALFEALTLREWLQMMAAFRQRLEADPAGGTLSGLTRHIITVSASHPLLRAALQRDSEMLGDLIRSDMGQETTRIRIEMLKGFLELLRAKNLLRADIDLQTQIKMIWATYTGFFLFEQMAPPGYAFTPDELANSVAEMLHRAFEPTEPPDPQALEEARQTLYRLLDSMIHAISGRYKEANA